MIEFIHVYTVYILYKILIYIYNIYSIYKITLLIILITNKNIHVIIEKSFNPYFSAHPANVLPFGEILTVHSGHNVQSSESR